MNHEILQQYNLNFTKTASGIYAVNNGNFGSTPTANNLLAAYIYVYNDDYQINRLLQDIDLALNEQFSQIENNDYAEDYAGEYTIWGEIMEGLDFELFDELSQLEFYYPLEDIKEIFESWLEFLQS